MGEMKPCPFCGNHPCPVPQNDDCPLPSGKGYFQTVWCESCGAEGGKRKTEAEAIEAWNRRALSPSAILEQADLALFQHMSGTPSFRDAMHVARKAIRALILPDPAIPDTEVKPAFALHMLKLIEDEIALLGKNAEPVAVNNITYWVSRLRLAFTKEVSP